MKLLEYSASAVSVVLSNPFVSPLSRIKISLLLAYTDELVSTPKIMTFLQQSFKSEIVNKNQILFHILNMNIY